MQVLDSGSDGIVIVKASKPDWPIIYVNAVIEEMCGFDAGEMIGRALADFVADQDLPAFPWDGTEELEQAWQCRGGGTVRTGFRLSPLYDRPGQPAYLMLSSDGLRRSDSAGGSEDSMRVALKDARVRLKRLERNDSVTGLINRKTFTEMLQRDWALARRERRPLALIVFEVDAFDNYRDLFGRHAADSVLRKVAHAINGSLRREVDSVARLDNARFVAMIGSAERQAAAELAAQIAARVRSLSIHHPRSDVDRFLTVSVGVASETPDWTAPASLLLERAEADLTLQETELAQQEAG